MGASQDIQVMAAIEAKLEELVQSGPLSVTQALDLAHEVADLAAEAAISLEENGHFAQAADLYEKAARAFQLAAEKVPMVDKRRLSSLEDFWSVKANRARRAIPPTPPAEQRVRPATDILLPKIRHETLPSADDESSTSVSVIKKVGVIPHRRWRIAPSSSRAGQFKPPAVAFKKSSEVLSRRRSVIRSPSSTDESGPLVGDLGKPGETQDTRPEVQSTSLVKRDEEASDETLVIPHKL